MHRALSSLLVMALTSGCADGVIQRMPPEPTSERPDPLADREADRVTAASQWPELVAAFGALAALSAEQDYNRREEAVESLLGRLNPALEGLEQQGALNPLARLDLVVVLEEIARSRLRGEGTTAGSVRQAERWDAAVRMRRFLDAAATNRPDAIAPAVCDVMLIADLRKFRLVLPCVQGRPDERFLERMPLDARVAVALMARLAAAASPGI